ncbi:MAG: hypothetical protein HY092_00375 [Candidatus Kerfeldbacteria bacterium]|nr:hypothetical protein [Candidatus Kerfeldbacteria bacterium]
MQHNIFLNLILPILLPIVVIGVFIYLTGIFSKGRKGWWNQPNLKFDWQGGLALSLMFLVATIFLWSSNDNFLFTIWKERPWPVLAGVALATIFNIMTWKRRGRKWHEVFLNLGYTLKDERESLLLLKATRVAYASTFMLLTLLYILALFTSTVSRTGLLLGLITIFGLSRTLFSFVLYRSGFSQPS